jgi:penicillin-binding protein 1A
MPSEKSRTNYYLRVFWIVFSVPVLMVSFLFVLISAGKLGDLPSFERLENPENNVASEIYSEDNELLGKFYVENRSFVEFEELSPHLVSALLATEDIRFEKHSGIDARGLVRVVFRTILGGQNTGGGSTISQQLAKNLFNTRDNQKKNWLVRKVNIVLIKFKEWNTAVRLERHYTKREILVMYLNTVSFGHEAYGIKSATHAFFNNTPDSLRVEQAAMLVGVLKAPTWYSPLLNPENCTRRRNVVLSQMAKYGYLEPQVKDSLMNLPLGVEFRSQSHTAGMATYFRTYIEQTLKAKQPVKTNYYSYDNYKSDSIRWETDPLYGWANKNFKPDGTPYNIYTDGLRINTTINSKMQLYAEEAVTRHLGGLLQKEFFEEKKNKSYAPFSADLTRKDIESIMNTAMVRTDRYRTMLNQGISRDSIVKAFRTPIPMKIFTWEGPKDTIMSPMDSIRYYKHFLRTGFMAMEPASGEVRAYVGGINNKYFQYDMVTQGKRQVGSTIKPFLYTLAMQEGYSPCDKIPNVPVTFIDHDSTYTPRNSGNFEMEGKMVTLEWALAHSVNYISAWLVKRFNPEAVVEVIKKMGVKSYILPVPSVIFGTSDIALSEMVGAFNTYSNRGVFVEPLYVTSITDMHGNLITNFQSQPSEAISEKTAYLMIQLMKNVVNRGTAGRLRWFFNFEAEMAGKTGTTQNHSDGWYIGLTPKLTAGVWVGAEDRATHFDYLAKGSGSYMALPIYGYFFEQVYADTSLHITQQDIFEKPEGFNMILDCPDPEKEAGIIRSLEEYEEF